jgi:osmotically inducible protein OsmC
MSVRKAQAVWNGTLGKGSGIMSLGSGSSNGAYSFSSRFENGKGSNPEELLGAAFAGCFSMALSMLLEQAGFPPTSIRTEANVSIDKVGDGFSITTISLDTEGTVPGCSDEVFLRYANAAKTGCPVAKALTGASVSLNARLVQK